MLIRVVSSTGSSIVHHVIPVLASKSQMSGVRVFKTALHNPRRVRCESALSRSAGAMWLVRLRNRGQGRAGAQLNQQRRCTVASCGQPVAVTPLALTTCCRTRSGG